METFLASTIVERVNGLNSEKTLNRWKKVVEDNFGLDYFSIENVPFNRKGNRRPVTVYSLEDIKRFQHVADILSEQPTNRKNLKLAIITAFSTDSPWVRPKSELEIFEENLSNKLGELKDEDKRLLVEIQESNRKIREVQSVLEIIRENKPKLFKVREKK